MLQVNLNKLLKIKFTYDKLIKNVVIGGIRYDTSR